MIDIDDKIVISVCLTLIALVSLFTIKDITILTAIVAALAGFATGKLSNGKTNT
jgi:hypothetical protein